MTWFAAYLAFTLFLAGLAWYPCCFVEPPTYETCGFCSGTEDIPQFFSVYIPPLVDADCSTCENYAGTYVVETPTGLGDSCQPNAIVADSCVAAQTTLFLTFANGTLTVLLTAFSGGGAGNWWRWVLTTSPGMPFDCMSLSDLSIPWDTYSTDSLYGDNRCTGPSGGTPALVTSGA